MSVCDGPRVSELDESRKKNSLAPAKTRRAAQEKKVVLLVSSSSSSTTITFSICRSSLSVKANVEVARGGRARRLRRTRWRSTQ
jgi:hypothetical protein